MKSTGIERVVVLVATCGLVACGGMRHEPTQPQPMPTPTATTDAGGGNMASAEDAGPPQPSYEQISAQAEVTLNYNDPSNFGGGTLRTGFRPDPKGYPLTAGGGTDAIEVGTLNLHDAASSEPCNAGYVTRKPDFHFTFEAGTAFPMVRFYVVTRNHADATLLINLPDTGWRCNDDHHHDGWGNPTMPAIDIQNPQSGRYDIWVGTYDASAHNPATLYVTELDRNHP